MLLIEEIIKAKLNAIKDVQENIFDYLSVAIEKNAKRFEDANREQLDAGILNTGAPIKAPAYLSYDLYSPRTVQIKRVKNQPTDRITLKDTGKFYKSIKLEIGLDGFELDSDDSKSLDLQKKYTIDILGISEENLNEILKEVEKELTFILKTRIENA